MSETLDELMNVYNRLVPHTYIPETGVIFQILDSVSLYEGYHLARQLWNDLVKFGFVMRTNIVSNFLSILNNYKGDDEELRKDYSNICVELFNALKDHDDYQHRNFRAPVSWQGEELGIMLALHCRAKNIERANQLFQFIESDINRIVGLPR